VHVFILHDFLALIYCLIYVVINTNFIKYIRCEIANLLNKIKAVVFDLDNTLVTSSLNFALIRQELGCPQEQDLLTYIEALPEDQKQIATERVLNHELKDAYESKPLEGCQALLETLGQLNLKTAIVTRNCRKAAQIKSNQSKLNIPIVITREDFPAKPSPDSLLHLLDIWQLAQDELLYVGDYLYDIQTAKNANVKSCFLTFSRETDYAHLADLVVKNLTELEQRFKSLHQELPIKPCLI